MRDASFLRRPSRRKVLQLVQDADKAAVESESRFSCRSPGGREACNGEGQTREGKEAMKPVCRALLLALKIFRGSNRLITIQDVFTCNVVSGRCNRNDRFSCPPFFVYFAITDVQNNSQFLIRVTGLANDEVLAQGQITVGNVADPLMGISDFAPGPPMPPLPFGEYSLDLLHGGELLASCRFSVKHELDAKGPP
jgi:hypothetical protein